MEFKQYNKKLGLNCVNSSICFNDEYYHKSLRQQETSYTGVRQLPVLEFQH